MGVYPLLVRDQGEEPGSSSARVRGHRAESFTVRSRHHIERPIEAGELQDYAEATRARELTPSRLTQVVNLLLLAPEVQERILHGAIGASERELRCVAAEPEWESQMQIYATATGIAESSV